MVGMGPTAEAGGGEGGGGAAEGGGGAAAASSFGTPASLGAPAKGRGTKGGEQIGNHSSKCTTV